MTVDAPGVYVVHAVDTEGPLLETLESRFESLEAIFGALPMAHTRESLEALKSGLLDLGGNELEIAEFLSDHRTETLGSWHEIEEMLSVFLSEEFRGSFIDSCGSPWKTTWFCLDHVGFRQNPRHRDFGMHNIFDRYRSFLRERTWLRDEIQWHNHAVSLSRSAHKCGSHYLNSGFPYRVLAERVVDRNWFPSVFRAGCHTERPDIHFFLEQWVPFDLSSLSMGNSAVLPSDMQAGQWGDWIGAPTDWTTYHPSYDDYRLPGSCKRLIGRALHPMNRLGALTQQEVDVAFDTARRGKVAILGVAGHDWRNLIREVEFTVSLLEMSQAQYPDVQIYFATAAEAFRAATGTVTGGPLKLNGNIQQVSMTDEYRLTVTELNGSIFGPQPFLALRTVTGEVLHDNFDRIGGDVWCYTFSDRTIPIRLLDKVSVASADRYGFRSVISRSASNALVGDLEEVFDLG